MTKVHICSMDVSSLKTLEQQKKMVHLISSRIRMTDPDPLVRYVNDSRIRWYVFPQYELFSTSKIFIRVDLWMSLPSVSFKSNLKWHEVYFRSYFLHFFIMSMVFHLFLALLLMSRCHFWRKKWHTFLCKSLSSNLEKRSLDVSDSLLMNGTCVCKIWKEFEFFVRVRVPIFLSLVLSLALSRILLIFFMFLCSSCLT